MWRWLAPVVVVALGVGVGAAFLLAGSVRAGASSAASAGHQPCVAEQVYFRDDDAMRRAAAVLENDPEARRVDLDPQALTWSAFKKLYQGDPAKIAATSESAMPATVVVLPVQGTDLNRYAAEFRQRFPDARKVQQLDVEAVWKKNHPGAQGFVCN